MTTIAAYITVDGMPVGMVDDGDSRATGPSSTIQVALLTDQTHHNFQHPILESANCWNYPDLMSDSRGDLVNCGLAHCGACAC